MTGISMFLVGGFALTNLGLIGYLLLDHNKKVKKNEPEPPPEPQTEDPELPSATKTANEPGVGKSLFNIDELEDYINKRIDQAVEEKVFPVIEEKMGRVKLKDVEFANSEDTPSSEEIANDEKESDTKEVQIPNEKLDEVFTDVRIDEIEPDTVSAPSASGATMEDIAESMETAKNPNSTLAERKRAGAILAELQDTNFMALFAQDPVIVKGINECIQRNVREKMLGNQDNKPKAKSKQQQTEVPKAERKSKEGIVIPDNLDDFDPADLLK